jgi:hypothetical protein
MASFTHIQIKPEVARDWINGIPTSTGDPELDQTLDEWQRDQEIWDATVLCAFEATTGKEGVFEDFEAFEAWLQTDAAEPAWAALKSARSGVWISPPDYHDAVEFWRAAAKATA